MAHVHAAPNWRYWFDFVLFPAVMFAAVVYDAVTVAAGATVMLVVTHLGAFVLGFVFWTFAEYWAHRSVLHTIFWSNHGTHLHHHKHPEDFVIFPLWYLPLAWAAFYLVMPLPFFAGFTAGYVWFLALHHMLHHWKLDDHPWLARYSAWHELHHKKTFVNYGITTPIWDKVFGTYKSPND